MTEGLTAMSTHTQRLPYALRELHPVMRRPMTELVARCHASPFRHEGTDFVFSPFEGYRTPMRQNHLFAIGKVTKAGPWHSDHQYGLAVDFACRAIDQIGKHTGWHWPEGIHWDRLKAYAIDVGLDVPISWDKGHVVHPLASKVRALLK